MNSRLATTALFLTMAVVTGLSLAVVTVLSPSPAPGASAESIDRDVSAALAALYDQTPSARSLGDRAKAILVFPNIVKAGFIVGAQYGDGAMVKDGKMAGYYNITAGSYGLQAGLQAFAYTMFFMTDSAVDYFEKSQGFEVGVGPSIVVVDAGMAKSLTTTTAQDDVYAFIFGQRGLMAGAGLQGSKITRIDR